MLLPSSHVSLEHQLTVNPLELYEVHRFFYFERICKTLIEFNPFVKKCYREEGFQNSPKFLIPLDKNVRPKCMVLEKSKSVKLSFFKCGRQFIFHTRVSIVVLEVTSIRYLLDMRTHCVANDFCYKQK